jgi:hypothetical protein
MKIVIFPGCLKSLYFSFFFSKKPFKIDLLPIYWAQLCLFVRQPILSSKLRSNDDSFLSALLYFIPFYLFIIVTVSPNCSRLNFIFRACHMKSKLYHFLST